MPNHHRKRASRIFVVILFLCLLLSNPGTAIFPVSAFQDADTLTPTFTLTNQVLSPEPLPSETTAPTGIPTDVSTPIDQVPTTTPTQTNENDIPDPDRLPLPDVFASGAYAHEELIVRFKPSTSRTRINECFQATEIQVQYEIEELLTFVVRASSDKMGNSFYQVLHCAGVLYVEPNFLLQAADTIPNDPDFGLQYGLANIRAPRGWDLATGTGAVTIAIIDSGVDYGHPDLAAKLVAGYDFVNDDNNPQDDYGHGTHVAGIAAASSNNNAGIAGVSWGARIMPVKVLNASGGGTYANTAAGVIWAVDHGAQVINLSLGGTGPSTVLQDAINYAHSRGAIIIAAAGNSGNNFVLYPARYPNVVAVARTNEPNNWDGSNYGPEIDLSAPGAQIYSTVPGGYGYSSGSSMSTGFVSGLAAILMSIPGNATPDLIEYQMESTALDIEFAGWDEYTGAGLIQMDAAVQLALQYVEPTPFPSATNASGGSPGGFQFGATNTPIPIPTWTASPIQSPHESTATHTPGLENTETATHTISSTPISPTEEVREVEAQEDFGRSTYVLPCIGLLLILFGILLLWVFTRKQNV